MRFEWNQTKAARNEQKHGVSFGEALSVFYDEHAIQFIDQDHADEIRYLLLGMSNRLRLLIVSHCEREQGEVIRIISARKATRKERSHYPKVP